MAISSHPISRHHANCLRFQLGDANSGFLDNSRTNTKPQADTAMAAPNIAVVIKVSRMVQ